MKTYHRLEDTDKIQGRYAYNKNQHGKKFKKS